MNQIKLKSCHRESKNRGANQTDVIEQEEVESGLKRGMKKKYFG